MSDRIRPVILAGGAGTRLWPISTAATPKHLLPLVGSTSLLEQTIGRFADDPRFAAPLIVCGADQAAAITALAPQASLIVEPCARNSAAAIGLAAAREDPDRLLLILPSDHHVGDPAPLLEAVGRARHVAEQGRIVTFGIRPTRAETGYGYVTPGAPLADGVFAAQGFREKPGAEFARALIDGGSLWNAGIFLMSAGTIAAELAACAPEIAAAVGDASAAGRESRSRFDPDRQAFQDCPAMSFDHAVLEHSRRVAVAPVELQWSDLGSWAAVYDLAGKDAEGNVLDEGTAAIGSKGCLIRSTGPEVVAVGVEDLVIIATPTHVLVVPRSEAQRVREAAELAQWSQAKARESDDPAAAT